MADRPLHSETQITRHSAKGSVSVWLLFQVPGLGQIGGFKSASALQTRGQETLIARVGSQLETVTTPLEVLYCGLYLGQIAPEIRRTSRRAGVHKIRTYL